MKSKLFLLILALMCMGLITCKKESDPYGDLNKQIVAEWEHVSDSILANSGVPGMIIGIWAPDRNLSWVIGKGKANLATGEKPDPSMKYRMGSLTKTYTYTVLLQLVDEGKISLSDKLSLFLPDFPKADSITIRMLCNHTSGIFDYTETNLFQMSLITDPLKKWTSQEMIDLVKTEPFYFSPGTAFKYSNTNTIIAGMIVEELTGNSIAAEIQHRILDALHLENTIYPTNQVMTGAFVHGYGWFEGDSTDVSQAYDPSMAGAADAMIADVYDLKSWVEHLYKGTLLTPETQTQRLTVVPATDEDCEEYGLGIMHKIYPPMWGHTGTIPGYKNWAGYCPTENVTIVINYNATTDKPMDLASRLMTIYLVAITK
ncbi:MAG: serine hydrolase [Bacteroidetes bacterium]|nr:serine hydrolase [Bacteroidota bacterium]